MKLSQVFKNRWVWVCKTDLHGHDLSVWKTHHLRDRRGKILRHMTIHGPKPGPEIIIAGRSFKGAVKKSKKVFLGELQRLLEVVKHNSYFYAGRVFSTSRDWLKDTDNKQESRCLAMIVAKSDLEEWDSCWPDEKKAELLKRFVENNGGRIFAKGWTLIRKTKEKANHHRGGSAPPLGPPRQEKPSELT